MVLYETEEDAHYLDQDGPHWVELFARIGPERSQHLASLLTEPIHRRVHAIIAEDLALLGK